MRFDRNLKPLVNIKSADDCASIYSYRTYRAHDGNRIVGERKGRENRIKFFISHFSEKKPSGTTFEYRGVIKCIIYVSGESPSDCVMSVCGRTQPKDNFPFILMDRF